MQLHRGQQSFDGRLVDHSGFVLGNNRVSKGGQLFHHSLVAPLCIELHNKIAALYTGVGGVAIGF